MNLCRLAELYCKPVAAVLRHCSAGAVAAGLALARPQRALFLCFMSISRAFKILL